jgi:transposase
MIKRAHILFTDESPIELQPKPNRQNRRIRTSDPTSIPEVPVPKFTLKIMVAGGISRYGKTALHIVNQGATVDGDYYRGEILPIFINSLKSRNQFPNPDAAVLMQDGARAHTAKATLKLIADSGVNVWTDWPGNSPDLNVIEHVWAILQESVFKEPRPRNREQLIQRVLDEWQNLEWEYLRDLVESFGRRITECLENDGKTTKY